MPCAFVAPNPKRARGNTSNSVLDYDHYMTATTVDEFFSRKGNWGHLKYDVQCVAASLIARRVDAVNNRSTQAGLLHARRGEIRRVLAQRPGQVRPEGRARAQEKDDRGRRRRRPRHRRREPDARQEAANSF